MTSLFFEESPTFYFRDDLTKGQRACIVLNAYEAEERRKAKERQREAGEFYGRGKEKLIPEMGGAKEDGRTSVSLAKKAGIGRSSMEYLIAVKRKRPDLFQHIFNGEYTIGKSHAEMKRDEKVESGNCVHFVNICVRTGYFCPFHGLTLWKSILPKLNVSYPYK
jgi:hypothetical protein